jgi:hypothetical protein
MKRESWPVTQADVTPRSLPGCCFWCKIAVGEEHAPECVRRNRTVVVEARFTMVMRFPEGWDRERIEFQLNGSSSCADNVFTELARIRGLLEATDGCLCNAFEGKYLREADETDEDVYVNHIAEDIPPEEL